MDIELRHADHGVSVALLAKVLDPSTRGFFATTFDLPAEEPDLWCALYGPLQGDPPVTKDEVTYAIRGDRPCASRMVDKPHRPTRRLTVIGVGNSEGFVVFTSYGGELSEREPGDTSLPTWEDVLRAREFWAVHALSSHPIPT